MYMLLYMIFQYVTFQMNYVNLDFSIFMYEGNLSLDLSNLLKF